jgi:hypothetical protein
MMSRWMKWAFAFVASLLMWMGEVAVPGGPALSLGPEEASAVVGRPATPVSYAGVARRTVRRARY